MSRKQFNMREAFTELSSAFKQLLIDDQRTAFESYHRPGRERHWRADFKDQNQDGYAELLVRCHNALAEFDMAPKCPGCRRVHDPLKTCLPLRRKAVKRA